MLPSQLDDIPSRDFDLLALYWTYEPWGAWRDNMHAAIIATNVIRPHLQRGKKVSVDDFMLQHPEVAAERLAKRRLAATAGLARFFRSVAVKKRV